MAAVENINITATLSTLITAGHILHHLSVLDSMGHVSVRNPLNASTFYMPLQLGPAVVSGVADIGLYAVEDGSPRVDENKESGVGDNAMRENGFAERFIHSEILRKYADVKSVVHSHNEDVLPYTVLGGKDDETDGDEEVSISEPVYHMAGFLGSSVPIFDVEDAYEDGDARDLLINTPRLGAALAAMFGTGSSNTSTPLHTTILQRGHGFVVAGSSVEQAVDYAYYATSNARVQTKALLLAGAMGKEEGVQYLSERERKDCKNMNDWIAFKPWKQWCREVDPKRNSLYENELGSPPGA